MKIVVAGQDRSGDLGPALQRDAAAASGRAAMDVYPPELHATSLKQAKTEGEYLARLMELVRRRQHADVRRFQPSRRHGFLGSISLRVRQFMWRVLHYQHEYTMSRQNAVNSHLYTAVDCLFAEVRRLDRRLDELERRSRGTGTP